MRTFQLGHHRSALHGIADIGLQGEPDVLPARHDAGQQLVAGLAAGVGQVEAEAALGIPVGRQVVEVVVDPDPGVGVGPLGPRHDRAGEGQGVVGVEAEHLRVVHRVGVERRGVLEDVAAVDRGPVHVFTWRAHVAF